MTDDPMLLDEFLRFGLAILLGFAIGIERELGGGQERRGALRDYVLVALIGGLSGFAADEFQAPWLIVPGLASVLVLLVLGQRMEERAGIASGGITSEAASIVTYFLGVFAVYGETEIAIALAIVTLLVLSQQQRLSQFRERVQRYELEAAVSLLIITFIVLPVLPQTPLDGYLTFPMGTVQKVDEASRSVSIQLIPGSNYEAGQKLVVYGPSGAELGALSVERATPLQVRGSYEGEFADRLEPGSQVRTRLGLDFPYVMLAAITPYKVWLIVVLVSFISFVGYILVKVLGADAGIGLTGLIGGLASSTVTSLSFARRSRESPQFNRQFAVAVVLASTIMFPRLLIQIAVVNQALMRRAAVPVLVMLAAGVLVAIFYFRRSRGQEAGGEALTLHNPFSLKSALTFAGVFSVTLMLTRLAIEYLGNAWLPLVSIVSGLTDADAIAFSLSNAEQAGLIGLDWAAFNLVLGAIANTFMKLLLVFGLGDRGLFKNLLAAFLVIGATGIATVFFYYDLSAAPALP
jgi:uncharacterized membrane protein (DUF4010 family)